MREGEKKKEKEGETARRRRHGSRMSGTTHNDNDNDNDDKYNATVITTAPVHGTNRTIDYSLLAAPELIDVVDVGDVIDEELPPSEDTGSFAEQLARVEQEERENYGREEGGDGGRRGWRWTDLGLGEFSGG